MSEMIEIKTLEQLYDAHVNYDVSDSEIDYDSCRYMEHLTEALRELKARAILNLRYYVDYQGNLDISVLLEDGRVFSYEYYYGSCSGCDEWEDRCLSNEEIKNEMLKDATYFDNIEQYNEFVKMKEKEQ